MVDMAQVRGIIGGDRPVNVGKNERIASVLAGGLLVGLGLRKRGAAGALLGLSGAILAHRGATGHCLVYGAVGMDSAREKGTLPREEEGEARVSVQATLAVNRPADELYAFWRDFRNAPRYMDRVVSVEVVDETHSRWTATGPRGRHWEWTSRVTEERPGELIAWETLPGADLPNRGSVQFLPLGDGAQTEVRYELEFDPPGGIVGRAIAGLFHEVPEEMIKGDLRRFRQLMETGEIPTTEGQPTGREEDGR